MDEKTGRLAMSQRTLRAMFDWQRNDFVADIATSLFDNINQELPAEADGLWEFTVRFIPIGADQR